VSDERQQQKTGREKRKRGVEKKKRLKKGWEKGGCLEGEGEQSGEGRSAIAKRLKKSKKREMQKNVRGKGGPPVCS